MYFKEFNYENCSLIDCISLLQSMLKSPHAYSQNKAFTKHILDALMQSYEGKLELEVSIPREVFRVLFAYFDESMASKIVYNP